MHAQEPDRVRKAHRRQQRFGNSGDGKLVINAKREGLRAGYAREVIEAHDD